MLPKEVFLDQVTDAYEHLYDLVRLRTHSLIELLSPGQPSHRKERAWKLHSLLLETIEELNPGPHAPAYSHEWRRYKLMVHRYAEGLDPQAVSDELAISRRHFYREREQALKAVAEVLWERVHNYLAPEMPTTEEEAPSRLEMLRLEAARMGQVSRQAHLPGIVQGVISLASELAARHGTWIECRLSHELPPVRAQRTVLRQILLGLVSYLVEHAEGGVVRIRAREQAGGVILVLRCQGEGRLQLLERDRLAMFDELAVSQGVKIDRVVEAKEFGFDLFFPIAPPPTVLVVDDNEDALELFQRCLSHEYRVVTAQSSAEALRLAEDLQPYAITLDLMMPDQDGWEALQILTNRPQTQRIPVIVCTVLGERALALALGATAFLEKPISQQALLGALEALE
jgi:CheY-like chemotaxis protein